MDKNIKKINARTITLTIIFVLILVVIALLIGKFSYSYLAPTVSDDVEGVGEVTASGDTIIFTKGNTLSLSATTDNFKTNGENLTATTNPKVKLMASSKTESASSKYFAGVIIKNNTYSYTTTDKKPEVILTVKDENGNIVESSADNLTFVTVNDNLKGFDITGVNGAFNIVTDHVIATSSNKSEVIHTWTFTLTFVNLGTDQSNNDNSTLNIEVVLQKDKIPTTIAEVCSNNDKLSDCIINFYEKLGLLYHHDLSLLTGAGDNSYRYAGANPDNYVCFGSDDATCPSDNLYRIIGVFDGKVKLIKYDYANSNLLGTDGDYSSGTYSKNNFLTYKGSLTTIDRYYWNYNNDPSINYGLGSNEWSTSLLNTINLNTNYLNNLGTTWSNMIEDTVWKVSGYNTGEVIAKTFYAREITNATKTVTAKIGLMYPSDYGFAADSSAWTTTLHNYSEKVNGTIIRLINWMHMGLDEWTISPVSSFVNYVFFVYDYGHLHYNGSNATAGYAVRPIFYLKDSVKRTGGSGTSDNPIRISL